jgi:hypothetical protein
LYRIADPTTGWFETDERSVSGSHTEAPAGTGSVTETTEFQPIAFVYSVRGFEGDVISVREHAVATHRASDYRDMSPIFSTHAFAGAVVVPVLARRATEWPAELWLNSD